VGIDPVVAGGHEDQGSVNDANLMAGVLKRHQVAVTLALNATRAALVANLTSLAHDSRCGDTVIVFLASYLFRVAQSGLQFVMSDMSQDFVDKHMDYAALKQEDENSFPAFLIPGSPAQREGHRIPGALDSSELLDYFDRLRENGVNVMFIADAGGANLFAGRMRNDFASWHALRTESESGGDYQSAKGAYFGIYAGNLDIDTRLPPGDANGGYHSLLTWTVASALSESGNPTFSAFTDKIVSVWEQTLKTINDTPQRSELDPVFESSNPYRSPFATGLATSSGTGESRLRNVDTRSIEVTAPPLQRGAAIVGLGSVLIQGKINSPTPPKAISANQTAGRVFADGTFQVTVPVAPGENNILLAAWWNDSDFVPRFFTVVAQEGENIVQEGRRYAVLMANQHYRDPDFPPLDTPLDDSAALASLLQKRYGFTTTAVVGNQPLSLILNDAADRDAMLKVLSQLRAVVTPADSLLVYYGGHGIYEKETDRAYWLPVDATRDAPQDWVSNADISDALARLPARHILVVADSCYAGAFRSRGGVDPNPAAQSRVQFLEAANLRQSRNFLTSGANEPVADGGGNGHSVFVRALLDALAQEKKPFTAGEMFAKLQSAVGGNAKQIPQYFPMKEGHDGGEFVFVPQSVN
jgi:hypothetical protein